MKNVAKLSGVFLVVGSIVGLAWANKACETPDGSFNIMISPSTLILSSLCDDITVHSNIPFSAVITTSVAVNGVGVDFTKADACGDLVARIEVEDLDGFLEAGEVVDLELSGVFTDGEEFAVSEIIRVKE